LLWTDLKLYLREPTVTEQVLGALRGQGIAYRSLKAQPATLEDVFLALTHSR